MYCTSLEKRLNKTNVESRFHTHPNRNSNQKRLKSKLNALKNQNIKINNPKAMNILTKCLVFFLFYINYDNKVYFDVFCSKCTWIRVACV